MPETSGADEERLCRLLETGGAADPSWLSVASEVRVGAQVVDLGRVRAEPALAMMQLRARSMPDFPMDTAALSAAAGSAPDRRLRYVAVSGSTVHAQLFIDESDAVVLCWVVPVGAGVVPADVGPYR